MSTQKHTETPASDKITAQLVEIWVPSRHSPSEVSCQHRLRTGRCSEKTANARQLKQQS